MSRYQHYLDNQLSKLPTCHAQLGKSASGKREKVETVKSVQFQFVAAKARKSRFIVFRGRRSVPGWSGAGTGNQSTVVVEDPRRNVNLTPAKSATKFARAVQTNEIVLIRSLPSYLSTIIRNGGARE